MFRQVHFPTVSTLPLPHLSPVTLEFPQLYSQPHSVLCVVPQNSSLHPTACLRHVSTMKLHSHI